MTYDTPQTIDRPTDRGEGGGQEEEEEEETRRRGGGALFLCNRTDTAETVNGYLCVCPVLPASPFLHCGVCVASHRIWVCISVCCPCVHVDGMCLWYVCVYLVVCLPPLVHFGCRLFFSTQTLSPAFVRFSVNCINAWYVLLSLLCAHRQRPSNSTTTTMTTTAQLYLPSDHSPSRLVSPSIPFIILILILLIYPDGEP